MLSICCMHWIEKIGMACSRAFIRRKCGKKSRSSCQLVKVFLNKSIFIHVFLDFSSICIMQNKFSFPFTIVRVEFQSCCALSLLIFGVYSMSPAHLHVLWVTPDILRMAKWYPAATLLHWKIIDYRFTLQSNSPLCLQLTAIDSWCSCSFEIPSSIIILTLSS